MRRVLPLLVAGALLAGCSGNQPALDDYDELPDFALQERSGREVRRDDLKGKVWVAAFVFTRCTGPCPQVSGSMARLQEELAGEKDVLLVNITVDPEHDCCQVLKDYADRYRADPDRWLFLTGKEDDVHRLISKGFKLAVEPARGTARSPGAEVLHSTKLALVDRRGHVRGYYDGRQVDDDGRPVNELPKLRQHVLDLLREKP